MATLEELIAQIPIRHNAISYLCFTGVTFGLVLTWSIWLRSPRHNRGLQYFALLTLALSLTTFDTFLCYTGWMKFTLEWNDSTEPLTLLFAPLLYLSTRFLLLRKPLPGWVLLLHFLPALLYALSQIGYYTEPLAVKFNAYKDAYFQEIPFASVPEGTDYSYQWIKDQQRWLLLIGFAVYGLLSARLWYRHRKDFGNPASNVRISKYRFGRYVILSLAASLGLMLWVYLNYEDDGGDHYLALFTFVIMLATLTAFLSESRFFQQSWLIDKYETSAGPDEGLTLDALRKHVETTSFFTSEDTSLQHLAASLGVHPNAISRLINQQTEGNYNDFLNAYRVGLAIEKLKSGAFGHLTIEAIGREVGFGSKSAFYDAFKKQTGHSPSQFMKQRG